MPSARTLSLQARKEKPVVAADVDCQPTRLSEEPGGDGFCKAGEMAAHSLSRRGI
jgi:hypothetical protein